MLCASEAHSRQWGEAWTRDWGLIRVCVSVDMCQNFWMCAYGCVLVYTHSVDVWMHGWYVYMRMNVGLCTRVHVCASMGSWLVHL